MKYLISISFLLLLLSCQSGEIQNAVSDEEFTADSLRAAADSIAELRRLHALQPGNHVHAPGSDLAAAAHQDPAKLKRMRQAMKENRSAGRAAGKARAQRLAMTMKQETSQ